MLIPMHLLKLFRAMNPHRVADKLKSKSEMLSNDDRELSSYKVGWLCLTSHRQRGHLETAPPFTDSCEGRKARF